MIAGAVAALAASAAQIASFNTMQQSRYALQQAQRQLAACRVAIQELDERHGETKYKFLWPSTSLGTEDVGDAGDADDESSRDMIVTRSEWEGAVDAVFVRLALARAYLRSQYFYCLYCGVEYSSGEELESKCPGETEEDH
jgi:hypothetical protein